METVVEYLYLHYKAGHFHMLITKDKIFNKLFLHEKRFQLHSLLKIGIVYAPHLDEPDILTKILLEVLNYKHNDPIFKENFELITTFMNVLLDDSKEKPIYNYQFNSFEVLYKDIKHRNITELFKIIKQFDPANSNIFEYFSDYKNCEPPQSADFTVNINNKNLNLISKAIWRHGLPLEVSLDVFNKAKDNKIFENGDFTEALYYLSSHNRNLNESIKQDWIKPGPFLIPLYYNLNLPITHYLSSPDALYDQLTLFGEPLIKSLIKLSQHSSSINLETLTMNLNFTPSVSPKLPSSLILSLFDTLKLHSSKINYSTLSTFLYSHKDQLKAPEIESLLDFFKHNWSALTPELQNEFEHHLSPSKLGQILNKGSKPISFNKLLEAQEGLKASMAALNVFELSLNSRIINKDLCLDFISLIGKVSKDQGAKIAAKVLELLSLAGNINTHFELLVKEIENKNLWPLLSMDNMLNFFFIARFAKFDKVKIPNNSEENFKYELLKIDQTEMLNEHPVVKIKCYNSFKYNTELEPRYLVSNDLELRKVSAELNTEVNLPIKEILKYLKMYALMVFYQIKPTEKCLQALKMYYKHREKSLSIQKIKDEVIQLISQDFVLCGLDYNLKVVNNSGEVMWKPDLYFKGGSLAFMVFDEEDYCYDAKGELMTVSLIAKVIRKQLESKNNLRVIGIIEDNWNSSEYEKKMAVVRIVRENYKTFSY